LAIAGLILCIGVSGQPVLGQPLSNEPEQWKQSIERPSRGWDYDGKRILGHVGFKICLWDATTGKLLHKMQWHKDHIRVVQFSPDGKHALSSSWMPPGPMQPDLRSKDTRTILWDLTTGGDKSEFPGQVAGEFSPDGKRIVTFSQRPGEAALRDAVVWDAFQGRRLAEVKLGERGDPYWGSLHFSPDGRSVVRVDNPFLLLFDASDGHETGKQIQRFARSLRYTSKGAVASIDKEQIRLTDIESGQAIQSIQHGLKTFWRDAWTHDGSRVAVIPSDESEIKIWDIKKGKMTTGAKNGPYPQQAAIISPDNSRLAVEWGGANDIEPGLGLYDMNTGQEIARIKLAEWGHLLGFSPESKTFLVGGAEFVIYNSENGKQIRTIKLLDDVSFEHDWNH
jgi:WD40 repeat protein